VVNFFEANTVEEGLDNLFLALGNDKRRNMVQTLAFRPATIAQLAAENGLSLPAMHKHVASLERANLILRKKVGRTNFVALNTSSLGVAQNWVNQYRTEWGNDEQTFDNYIASLN
jgi:predicted transcriptional regulator